MVDTLSSAPPEREGTALGRSTTPAPGRSRRDLFALAKFVLAGCAGNVVYSLVFLALAQSGASVTVPSVIASVVSTLAVNEAHRLWTFRAIGRPSVLQAHLSGAASALVGTGSTAVVLVVWTWVSPDASVVTDLALSWCVTALVGAGSFLHLRRTSTAGRGPAGGRAARHAPTGPGPRSHQPGGLTGRC